MKVDEISRRKGDPAALSRITITTDGEEVRVNMENCSDKDALFMCGALQQVIGINAAKGGTSFDDVRDGLLAIHIAAMEELAEYIRKEGLA